MATDRIGRTMQQAPGDDVVVAVDHHRRQLPVAADDQHPAPPPVEPHRHRIVEQMARQHCDVGRLIGLLAFGVEELAQLTARRADEQGGAVDLDRIEAAGRPGHRSASAARPTTVSGVIGRAAHHPLAGGREHLQEPAGHQPAYVMLLVAGEAEGDRLVVEAGALIEVERMPGLREPQPIGHVARAGDDQPLLMDRDASGPPMRLAERLLGPIAGRLAVLQRLEGHAVDARCRSTGSGLTMRICAPVDRDHRSRCVGVEHGLAGDNSDEAPAPRSTRRAAV